MTASNALALSLLGSMVAIIGLIAIVMWVLLIIAHWKMFDKAGEAGWKSLIPIYSDYTLFKLVWSPKGFWIYVGCILLTAILGSLNQSYVLTADGNVMQIGTPNLFLDWLGIIAYISVMITYVVLNAKTAIAYGKGPAFAFGLVLLPNIFTMILAFGSAEYRGPQS